MPADRRLGRTQDGASQRTEPLDTEKRPREDVIAGWRDEGYTTRMEIVTEGRIRCGSCGEATEAEDSAIEQSFRYEGISDPEDMELLLAIACGRCGAKGTLTVAFGAYTSANEADALRRLPDHRNR